MRMGTIAIALLWAMSASAQQPSAKTKVPTADEILNVPVGGYVVGGAPAEAVRNPYEGDKAAIARGRQLFDAMNCSGCHAPDAGGGMGPPLSDADWIYGSQPGDLFLTIKQGRPNGMPAFQHLPNDVIWQLVAYVQSIHAAVHK